MRDVPPMPTSQEEWAAHWALHQDTLQQRDAAWREIEALEARWELVKPVLRALASQCDVIPIAGGATVSGWNHWGQVPLGEDEYALLREVEAHE